MEVNYLNYKYLKELLYWIIFFQGQREVITKDQNPRAIQTPYQYTLQIRKKYTQNNKMQNKINCFEIRKICKKRKIFLQFKISKINLIKQLVELIIIKQRIYQACIII